MDKKFALQKIGMNTCFVYINVSFNPMMDINFYEYSNCPYDIAKELIRNYLIGFLDYFMDDDWTDEADPENVKSMLKFLNASGYEDELAPIMGLMEDADEFMTADDLVEFAAKLRPLVGELDDFMDYSVCANIIELLQFLRQFDEMTTIEDLFDDYLGGAELDCDYIV